MLGLLNKYAVEFLMRFTYTFNGERITFCSDEIAKNVSINPFLFGRSFLRMLFINAKALFMRFYVLSMHFVSMCLNIVLSHAFSE